MDESSKTDKTKEPLTEIGADTFERFRNYQAPYSLKLALQTLDSTTGFAKVYCDLDEDVVVERVDGTTVAIQVASQQPGQPALKVNSEKFLRTIKNFALLKKGSSFNPNDFGIVSSVGFHPGNNDLNVQVLIDQCRKSTAGSEALPADVLKWVQKRTAEFRTEPTLSNYSDSELISLISSIKLEVGSHLHTINTEVKECLRGIPIVDSKGLNQAELDTLFSSLLSQICDAACVTLASIKTEISEFSHDAKQRQLDELWKRKKFDKERVTAIIDEELRKIQLSRLAPTKALTEASSISEPFLVEIQQLKARTYQVKRSFNDASNGIAIASLTNGTVLVEVSTDREEAASQSGPDYNPILDQVKEYVDKLEIGNAKQLLSRYEASILKDGNARHKFRFHTNFGAALEIEGNNSEAAKHLFEALQFAPNDIKANCNASYAAIISDDLAEAERYARKAIELDPNESGGYSTLIAATRSNKSLEEVLEEIPDAHRKSGDVAYALGCFAKELLDLEKALYWFEIAAKAEKAHSTKLKMQLGEVLLRIATQSRDQAALGSIGSEKIKMVERALVMFDEVWQSVGKTVAADQYSVALINIAYAARVSRNKEKLKDCLNYIVTFLENHSSNEQLTKAKGLLEVDSGKLTEAMRTLELISNPEDPEILYLSLELSNDLGKAPSYRAAFRKLLAKDDQSARIEATRIRATHSIDSGKFRVAKRLLKILSREASNSLLFHVIQARFYRCTKQLECARTSLQAAKLLIRKDTSLRERLDYAAEAHWCGCPRDSVAALQPIVDTSSDNLVTKRYVEYLYRCGDLPAIREICSSLVTKSRESVFYYSMLATTSEEVNDLPSAIRHFQSCISNSESGKATRYQIQLCHISYRTGDYASVDSFLSSHIETSDLEFLETSILSRLYVARGHYFNAIKTVYDCRRRLGGIELDRLYAAAFFNVPKDNAEWLDIDKVMTDSAVQILTDSNQEFWFILESDERKLHGTNELHVSNVLAQRLLGRKKGDRLEVTNDYFTGPFKIGEVVSKYVFAYQKSLPAIAVRTIDTSDTKKLVEELEKDANERREFGLKLEAAYNECQVSLERLTEATGIDIFDGWECFTQIPGKKLLCSLGNDEEIEAALSHLKSSPKVVLDFTSLLTLQAMPQIAEKLLSCAKEVIVAQSVLDDLDNQIFARSGHKAGGYGIFSSSEAGNSFHEISKEKIKVDHDRLVKLREWVRKFATTKPCKEYLQIKRDKRLNIEGILGDTAAESVLLAKGEGAILCADDLFLRGYSEKIEKTSSICTEALLLKSHQLGNISDTELIEGRLILCRHNYYYVHVGHEVLLKAAEYDDWDAGLAFETTARLLDDPTTPQSAFQVVWGFLFSIFQNHMDFNKQMRICECLLDKATASRDKLEFLKALLTVNSKLPIQNFGRQHSIRQFLERWAISRSVVKPWEKVPE